MQGIATLQTWYGKVKFFLFRATKGFPRDLQRTLKPREVWKEAIVFWQGPWGNEQEVVRTDFRFHCPSGASAQHVGPRWVSWCYGSCGRETFNWGPNQRFSPWFLLGWFPVYWEIRNIHVYMYIYVWILMYFEQSKWYDLQAGVILKSHSRVEKLEPVFGMKLHHSINTAPKVSGEAGKAVSILDVTWPQMQVSYQGDWWSSKNFTATSSNS